MQASAIKLKERKNKKIKLFSGGNIVQWIFGRTRGGTSEKWDPSRHMCKIWQSIVTLCATKFSRRKILPNYWKSRLPWLHMIQDERIGVILFRFLHFNQSSLPIFYFMKITKKKFEDFPLDLWSSIVSFFASFQSKKINVCIITMGRTDR